MTNSSKNICFLWLIFVQFYKSLLKFKVNALKKAHIGVRDFMEKQSKTGSSVREVQHSLDKLQESVYQVEYSEDSLLRLNKALKDINEEVNLLRNIIQLHTGTN